MRLLSDPAAPRPRVFAIASILALSLWLSGAATMSAQAEGPEATIRGLAAALEAGDLEAVPSFHCPGQDGAASKFDLVASLASMPPGLEARALLDVFALDVELASTEIVSQTATEAVVEVEGFAVLEFDVEAIRLFAAGVLSAAGGDATPDLVEAFVSSLLARLEPRSVDLSGQIALAPDASGTWLICDREGE